MIKLWILMAVSLILAGLIDNRDRGLANRGIQWKDKAITWLLILVLAFFCGLRTKGNDTGTYIEVYQYRTIPLRETLQQAVPSFASSIALHYVSALLKSLNFSAQDYLLFFAFATIIPYVKFLRRYSKTMVFGVFLMFATGMYTFSLAALKQCMAIGICLMALPSALDRKWLRYVLLVFLASLFHPYAVVYLIVPFMMFKPLTSRTYVYMAVFVVAGFLLESLIGTILNITDMMGSEYSMESLTGDGVNVFRVLVCFVPLVIAFLGGKAMFTDSTEQENLMFNLSMVNALIMFVGLFGTANYFARLANYFLPAQVITLPWLLRRIAAKDRVWLSFACVIGYLGYFIYDNNVHGAFDEIYLHMSFWEYLKTLF